MPTKYNLKRRAALRGMRTRRDFLADLWARTKTGVEIVIGLLIVIAVLGWASEHDLRVSEEMSSEHIRAKEARTSKTLAHVLNGKAVMERETGTVLFVQVSRQEGL